MIQTMAIWNDSLRFLRSSSLFWISIALSVLVSIVLLGTIRFDENGWGVLWFATNESSTLFKGSDAAESLIRWLFGGAMMWWWLTWLAILLALISTAGIMPEFVASGSIDIVVAKPIGRLRLFLTKFSGSLLFVLTQVTLGVAIAYLLAGFRFGLWVHAAWLAIPLVLIQFLYLYSVMTLVGVFTKSTLASLLAVLLFWGTVSTIQFTSNQMDKNIAALQSTVGRRLDRIEQIKDRAAEEDRDLSTSETSRITNYETEMTSTISILDNLEPWQSTITAIETCVPKTGDIQKIIAEQMDAPTLNELVWVLQGGSSEAFARMAQMQDREQAEEMQQAGIAGDKAVRSVNVTVSLGTSLGFTIFIIFASIVIFIRRDF